MVHECDLAQVAVKRIRAGQHATLAIQSGTPPRQEEHVLPIAKSASDASADCENGSLRGEGAVARHSATDRRHDTWREQQRAGGARRAASAPLDASAGGAATDRHRNSFGRESCSGGSEQAESPRSAACILSAVALH